MATRHLQHWKKRFPMFAPQHVDLHVLLYADMDLSVFARKTLYSHCKHGLGLGYFPSAAPHQSPGHSAPQLAPPHLFHHRIVCTKSPPRTPPPLPTPLTLINEDKFKHILRDSIKRRALLSLEDRRPRQFQGILGALDREACQVLLSEGTEFDKALLRGWLTGALWTAARAHARGLRATPLCPYCSRQQEEDDEHILWACPAWGIHRSGAWRSLTRTARALGLSD